MFFFFFHFSNVRLFCIPIYVASQAMGLIVRRVDFFSVFVFPHQSVFVGSGIEGIE